MRNILAAWMLLSCASAFGQGSTALTFDTVAKMTNTPSGGISTASKATIYLRGYYAAGDGGGGELLVDNTATNDIDNGIYFPIKNSPGRYVRVDKENLTVKMFGAKGDELQDESEIINRAIVSATRFGTALKLTPNSRFRLDSGVRLVSGSSLIGAGPSSVLIKHFDGDKPYGALVTTNADYPDWGEAMTIGVSNIVLRDFKVESFGTNSGPLVYLDGFDNVEATGIHVVATTTNVLDWGFTVRGNNFRGSGLYIDTRGIQTQDGFHVIAGTNGSLVNSTIFSGDDMVVLGNSRDQSIADWTFGNISGGSTHGFAISLVLSTNTVAYPTNFPPITAKIERLTFTGFTAFGGYYRNGILRLEEDWQGWQTNAPTPGNLRDIVISDSVFHGGPTNTHQLINPWGARIIGGKNIRFDNVTIRNSIRTALTAEGVNGLSLHNMQMGPVQLGAYRALEVSGDVYGLTNNNVDVVGGTYIVDQPGQSAIVFKLTSNVRVSGAYVEALGNAITFSDMSSNCIAIGNHIMRATNGLVTSLDGGEFTFIGNRFTGVMNQYSGTPTNRTILDNYLDIRRDTLGTLMNLQRSSSSAAFSWQGSRFWLVPTSGGLVLGNTDADETPKVGTYMIGSYDTAQVPFVGLHGSSTLSTNSEVTIGGGSSANNASLWVSIAAGVNHTNLSGTKVARFNTNGLLIGRGVTNAGAIVVPSAALEIRSTNQGFLPPRMTTTERDAIATPATGLLVLNTTTTNLQLYNGSAWVDIGSGGSSVTYTNGVTNSAGVIHSAFLAGSNITLTTNSGAITIAGVTSTNSGTVVTVDGGSPLVIANFDDGADINFGNSSSNVTGTVKADSVGLGTDTTGNYVQDAAGTANHITVSGSGSESASLTFDLASVLDIGGLTSFEIPNGGSPSTGGFGQIAGDNDAWAASRGAVQFYDGTANTYLIGALVSDTPSNGQVPKWNTGGTITWEDDSTGGGGGGSGTNAFVNGLLTQPFMLTNAAALTGGIVWLTNASGETTAYATNISVVGGGGLGTNAFVNNTLHQPLKLTNSTSVGFRVLGNGDVEPFITNAFTTGHYTGGFLPLFAGSSNSLTGDLYYKQANDIRSPMWEDGTEWNAMGLRANAGVWSVAEYNTNDTTVLEEFITVDPTDTGGPTDFITIENSGNNNEFIVEPPTTFNNDVTFTANVSVLSDTAFAASWDTVTSAAGTKNAVYDWGHVFDTDDDGKVNVVDIASGFALADSGGALTAVSATGSGNVMRTRTGVIREIWIPANAMGGGTSDAPTASTNVWATTTDGQRAETWDFSATSTNSVYWTLTLPQAWDAGTVKAKVHFKQVTAEATSTNVWAFGGGSLNSGETGGNTLGTLVNLTTVGANDTNVLTITAATSAVTIGGSPAAGHLTWFTLKRLPGHADDNSSVLERLFGVQLQYTETTTEPSAW